VSRDDVMRKVSDIFCDVMDLDEVDLKDETTADDVDEWDSLSHVRLIVSVEKAFSIKFSNAEIAELSRFGDLIDAILAKTAT
jgi:acyl carrier protein